MRTVVAALVALGIVCAMWAGGTLAAEKENSDIPLETLVAGLALIDSPAPGLAGADTRFSFMAEDEFRAFVPPQMRELVRRGPGALPILLRHLDDKRPTNLNINTRLLTWTEFGDEYHPRIPAFKPTCGSFCLGKEFKEPRMFKGPYLVKIGDVCFVLIGQIVNRYLTAVLYDPPGGMIVNSPIEAPSLSERTRADWDNLDAQGHEASLLADVKASPNMSFFRGGLARLRFYYPNAYAKLYGEDAKKRDAFEIEEKMARAARP
jgi:hypothetical protein